MALLLAGLATCLVAPVLHAQSFSASGVSAPVLFPTSLQFGPDDRLYVAQQDGMIRAFTVQRNAPGDYTIVATELIDAISAATPNHDDDGAPCTSTDAPECGKRQVTGILVTGSAANPVLYVTSSDARISVASDSGLDTNSGIVSRLRCSGGISAGGCQAWERVDIVRGLPRSEENHSTNGMALDPATNTLYVASGGNTNKGAIGSSFSGTPEYYLAGAILSVDLDAIAAIEAGSGPYQDPRGGAPFVYDLPTLDDPTRGNITSTHPDFPYPAGHPWHGLAVDLGDPFGGNNGLNQAVPEPGGPVQVHSPGYRNPYDVLVTQDGALFTWDNGPNSGWGGTPVVYDASGVRKGHIGESGVSYDSAAGDYCTNELNEWGSGDEGDTLVHITGSGFYGGHPAPTRAFPNLAGIYNYVQLASGHWEQSGPVFTLEDLLPSGFGLDISDFPNDPRQCDYTRLPVALEVVSASTNGLAEYTAANFGGAMHGDLLVASFNGNVYRCKRDGSGGLVDLPGSGAGTSKGKCEVLLGGFGAQPLDVTAQGGDAIFPGTIWAATYGESSIVVFEPTDFGSCDPSSPGADSDGDGYSNGDEQDNGTNPCSAGSKPEDFDGDFVSDRNDGDDDGDGTADVDDPFALDAADGLATALPLHYPLFNNDPGTGLFGLGFTGLMLPGNGSDAWLDLFDPEQLAAGGAAGLFTVEQVTAGDALDSANDQHNGFLFGIAVDGNTDPFVLRTRLMPPFFEVGGAATVPQAAQSYGLFIGTGGQDDYLKLVVAAVGGGAGLQLVSEHGGSSSLWQYDAAAWGGADLLQASAIDLSLALDPQAGTVQARVRPGADGSWFALGPPRPIPAAWLSAADDQGLAVGVISTARSPGGTPQSFGATWDFLAVEYGTGAPTGAWTLVDAFDAVRHENGFVQAGDAFHVIGGRESAAVRSYDLASGSWSTGASAPVPLHHVQAVTLDGLVYALGALTGGCCNEPAATHVYLYDPLADHWTTGPAVPVDRVRGAAGVALADGSIYMAGGNANGHDGPASALFDVFDPATGIFTALPPMPHARDHFALVHHQGKLYAVGGRDTNVGVDGDPHDDQVAAIDVFDLASGSWSTLPSSADLPTPRSGVVAAVVAGELVVAGGESGTQGQAHAHTEALDFASNTWRTLAPMRTPRHGTQALLSNGGLYVVAGSDQRDAADGSLLALEAFHPGAPTAPAGTPIAAGTLAPTPSAVDFGSVEPGSQLLRTVTVHNSGGNQGLVIEAAAVSGHAAFSLAAAPDMPFVLAPGASAQFQVAFAPTGSGSKTATLNVQRAGGTGAAVPLTGKGNAAAPQADLSVELVEDNDPVAEGATLVYTVTVANAGPDAATGVTAETTLSPLLAEPSTVGCESDPIGVPTCLLEHSTLAPGEEAVWLISVDVDGDAGGQVASSVVSVRADQGDPQPGDNTAGQDTDIAQGAPGNVADLSVFKTAEASFSSSHSGLVGYTIVAANQGPATVQAASVVDLLPAELQDAQWSCSASGGGASCSSGGSGSIDELVDLPPGTSVTFTVTATFAGANGDGFVNTAMIMAPEGITDPDPADNESSALVAPLVFRDGFESP